MSLVSLVMIVKDEAETIERTLMSTLPLIDRWTIVDTGSTDDTVAIVERTLASVPGRLLREPFVDYSTTRNLALDADADGPNSACFQIMLSGGETIALDSGCTILGVKKFLVESIEDNPGTSRFGSFMVRLTLGSNAYDSPRIINTSARWRYVGKVHEALLAGNSMAKERGPRVPGISIDHQKSEIDIKRDAERWMLDKLILEKSVQEDPNDARSMFYLGQTYEGLGLICEAEAAYSKRIDLGGWWEEVFEARRRILSIRLERCSSQKGCSPSLSGYEMCDIMSLFHDYPHRAEPLYIGATHALRRGDKSTAFVLANAGAAIPYPTNDILFVDDSVYKWRLWDLIASTASAAGLIALGKEAAKKAEAHRPAAKKLMFRRPKPARVAHRAPSDAPLVLLAILAKQKETVLQTYLACIEELDYPKDRISLYVRTNNNTDGTEHVLAEWLGRVGSSYRSVDFDRSDVPEKVEEFGVHEWNSTRFKVLGDIRNKSLQACVKRTCDFYFVVDVDNFIRSNTLIDLVDLNKKIVAPLLKHVEPGQRYSNYHAAIDKNGYYAESPIYEEILYGRTVGVIEVPVVHCTYLIRIDAIPSLTYDDSSGRYEYVIFSESARKANIPQFIDNRCEYGCLTLDEDVEAARAWMGLDAQAVEDVRLGP